MKVIFYSGEILIFCCGFDMFGPTSGIILSKVTMNTIYLFDASIFKAPLIPKQVATRLLNVINIQQVNQKFLLPLSFPCSLSLLKYYLLIHHTYTCRLSGTASTNSQTLSPILQIMLPIKL